MDKDGTILTANAKVPGEYHLSICDPLSTALSSIVVGHANIMIVGGLRRGINE